jgi:hypothetical protein
MSKIDILDEASKLHEKIVDDIVKEQNVSSDYFEFKHSTGNEIGRTFPQVDFISFTPEIYSIYDFSRLPAITDFNGRIELKKSAKPTDLLSSWQHGNGIMISSRCYEIVKKFNLGKHAFYHFKCIHKFNEYDYVYLALDNHLVDMIDYSKSIFYTTNLFDEFIQDISFSSKSEMLNYISVINKDKYNKEGYKEGLVEKDLELKNVFIKSEYHYLDIIERYSTYYISKRLKDILEVNNMTGIEFKQTKRIFK